MTLHVRIGGAVVLSAVPLCETEKRRVISRPLVAEKSKLT
jgi:hypothetical protein